MRAHPGGERYGWSGERHAVPKAWPPPTKFRAGIWGVGQVVVPYGGLRKAPSTTQRGVCGGEGGKEPPRVPGAAGA